jgi:hypothetical protein
MAMDRYEEKISELRTVSHDVDYDLQFSKIQGKISVQKRRSRIRTSVVALLVLVAAYGSISLPGYYLNSLAMKDNYEVSYILNDDPGNNNALSEYIFAQ